MSHHSLLKLAASAAAAGALLLGPAAVAGAQPAPPAAKPAPVAPFYGSLGGQPLNSPIVDMVATPDGHGYWLLNADGHVYAFGDAHNYGSVYSPWNSGNDVAAMAATPDGHGYWVVTKNGRVFTGGDAVDYGDLQCYQGCPANPVTHTAYIPGNHLSGPITSITATADGHGYWLVGADGGVFSFGDAPFWGSAAGNRVPGFSGPFRGLQPTTGEGGYYLYGGSHAAEIADFGNASGGVSPAGCLTGSAAAPQAVSEHFPHRSVELVRYGCNQVAVFRHPLNAPIFGAVHDLNGGYWLWAADGGVFSER